MDKIKNILIIAALVVVVIVGIVFIYNSGSSDGLAAALTYSAALNKQEVYNLTKAIIDDIGVSGSLSWDPGAVSSSTIATTSITVSGVALGDLVIASFDSATSTDAWKISGKVSAANTVLVIFESVYDNDLASLNITTSTVRVRVASSTRQSTL